MWKSLLTRKRIQDVVEESENKGSLKRSLGALNLTNLGIGAIIGAGIFVMSGQAAADYAGPGIVFSMIFAACLCLLAALCYAEMASMIPVAGGVYSYTYVSMGEFIAWTVGWVLTFEYLFSATTVAVGWSGYFVSLLHDMGISLPEQFAGAPFMYSADAGWYCSGSWINLPAVCIFILMGCLVARGTKGAASVNNILVIIKMAVIALFVGLGFFYVTPANWHPFIPENTGVFGQYGWSGVLRASGVIFFAFIGFDALSTLAQEVKKPQKDLPLGMIGSLGISTVVYVLVGLVMTGLVSYKILSVPDPIAVALSALGPQFAWFRFLISLAILAGLTSVVMVMLLTQTRIFYSMGHDGLLPKKFAEVNPKYGTPFFNTMVVTFLGALVCGLFPVGILGPIVSMGTLLAFAVVCFGVLLLRYTQPHMPRPFKTPFVPYVPLLGTFACLFQMALLPGVIWLQLIGWIVIGTVIYFCYGRRHSKISNKTGSTAHRL